MYNDKIRYKSNKNREKVIIKKLMRYRKLKKHNKQKTNKETNIDRQLSQLNSLNKNGLSFK